VTYLAPAPLDESHHLDGFICSHPSLEVWLKRQARKNHASGASRVFVVAMDDRKVVGYYALAAGSVLRALAPGRVSRSMPEPVPIALLGRLAVHLDHAGRGLGAGLLQDAVMRAQRLAEEIGIRALLSHALDEQAVAFYLDHGFVRSPVEPLTVMLPLAYSDPPKR
jgi:GNAT superfamily N-acetyltransferase